MQVQRGHIISKADTQAIYKVSARAAQLLGRQLNADFVHFAKSLQFVHACQVELDLAKLLDLDDADFVIEMTIFMGSIDAQSGRLIPGMYRWLRLDPVRLPGHG